MSRRRPMKKKLLNKQGSFRPLWSIISFLVTIVILLALLKVLGIEIPAAEFIAGGIEAFKENVQALKNLL